MRDTVSVVSLAARSETTLLLYALASTVPLPKNPLLKDVKTIVLSINFAFFIFYFILFYQRLRKPLISLLNVFYIFY